MSADRATYNIFRCAECGESLSSTVIRHGWVTVPVGFGQARVHTLCRRRFAARTMDEQKALVGKRT